MNTENLREYFIKQVMLANDIMTDIEKHDASIDVLIHVNKFGYCSLNGSEDAFVRVDVGGAYAYLDTENGKPLGKPIWWNNEDLGCEGLGYEETIHALKEMTEDEILHIPEVAWLTDDEELVVPTYVPFA